MKYVEKRIRGSIADLDANIKTVKRLFDDVMHESERVGDEIAKVIDTVNSVLELQLLS
jgi:hypothetical protein